MLGKGADEESQMESDFITDFCIEFCLPVGLFTLYIVGGSLVIDGFCRLKAKLKGEKYESPIVW